jgi:hypothetical protein
VQWAETMSLELKGFARIMKASIRVALDQDWFFATWTAAIDIFVTAVRTPTLMSGILVTDTDITNTHSYMNISYIYVRM